MMLLKDWLENEPRVTSFCVVVSVVCLILSFGGWLAPALPFDIAWPAIILCGGPILVGACRGLIVDHDVKADVLVSLALVASVATQEWFAAGEVALIMQIGSLLEDYTSNKAREGVESMAKLVPHMAHVLRDGKQVTVDAEEVTVGDCLVVLAGETIPVDGTVVEGTPSIDQSVMTGESVPVDKKPGDGVISGTRNEMTPFEFIATSTTAASSMQRMVNLARAADADKTPIVRLADKWATYLVFIALGCAIAAWAITGEFMRAVTVLVVFCPCAFILATPTAIAAGLANATRHGVLIRSGESIERLAKVNRVALDKTGTLTQGKPTVSGVASFSSAFNEKQVLTLASAAEQRSEHPLGRAIVESAEQNAAGQNAAGQNAGQKISSAQKGTGATEKNPLWPASNFATLPGSGVTAQVGGHQVAVGKPMSFVNASGYEAAQNYVRAQAEQGATVVLVCVDGKVEGAIALSDTLREGAPKAVTSLKNLGMQPLLLTGDHAQAAASVARAVGIDDVRAELLPEDKLNAVRDPEGSGQYTCMVGDGVNDALAMSAAYAGVSMGEIGSDVAVETADAILAGDDITRLPYTLEVARATMRKVRQNITLGLIINFLAVTFSIAGVLNPVTGALWHNCGSVFVVVNAALLLRWEPKQ